MTAQSLLQDLTARGVVLSADGDRLAVDGPDDVLTDELLATLREHKAELLEMLTRSAVTERPRLGSFARPMPVRGTRMPMDCLWATCDGHLSAQGHNRYLCSICATWFELLPPQDLGVYVGDLAEEDAGDVAGWVM